MNIRDSIRKIKNSKDGRTLVANFGYLSLLQVASYIFPLITIPYLARVIGVDSFGKIAFASAIITWFKTIADWGFNYTATRDVAKNRNDREKVSDIYSNVLWARIFLAVISFAILTLAILVVPKFKENYTIILYTFLLIPGHVIFPDWFFQAMEKMRYITILNLLSKLLFTMLIFVFIKEKEDFVFQPLIISLGYLLSGVISMYIILIKWRVELKMPNVNNIVKTISRSTDVFINNLMPNLYNSFSILLLGFFGGSISNGLLNSGSKFVNITQEFISIISRTFYPFLSRRIDKHTLYSKINISISLFLAGLLFLFAPVLIKLFFTPEFYDSIVVLRIMSVSLLFQSLINIYGTNYMIIQGYEKKLRNITFVTSLIGFFFSFPLIYFFDYIGTAIIVTMTRGILGIWIMCSANKLKTQNKRS